MYELDRSPMDELDLDHMMAWVRLASEGGHEVVVRQRYRSTSYVESLHESFEAAETRGREIVGGAKVDLDTLPEAVLLYGESLYRIE